MAAPSILEIYPAQGAEGVVLSDVVSVIFDREVDESTVQIVIEGPDTDRWTGPDLMRWDDPATTADDDILATPGYKGIVAGALSFEYIDGEGQPVSQLDYTGGGTTWNTKAIFTPERSFSAGTTYRVYVMGQEEGDDTIPAGVSSRTVFDAVKGSNLGDGNAFFSGGYTGTIEDQYNVRITVAGEAGDAEMVWWKTSAPLVLRELDAREASQVLDNGISVRFSGDFVVNDEFHVVVEPADRMQSTYTWTFETGSGSITTVPSSVIGSTTITGVTGQTGTTAFTVLSVTPVAHGTNLDPDDCSIITVRFSGDIDPDTITDAVVEIWSEPVNGIFDGNSIVYNGVLAKVLEVDGDTLTIRIA